MLERPYYLVLKFVKRKNVKYPYLITCALKDHGFYRIESLEQYLYDGSGVSNEYVAASDRYYKVIDENWDVSKLLERNSQ